ncbi:MAG: hypothetical protein ACQESN_10770 [Thermotogota bacterium]
MIFLKDIAIEELYVLNRKAIEQIAANRGEFVTTKKENEEGSYLTNDFKILFDEDIKEDKQILDADEYMFFKENSDKDIDFIIKRLNKKYAKDTIIRNILYNIKGIDYSASKNKREVIFFFKEKQKELIVEILNNKKTLKPVLKIIPIDEIVEFDNHFASVVTVFPSSKQRRQLRRYGLIKKIGTRFFIARKDISEAKKKLENLYGKKEVIIQEDEKLCEKI